MLVGLVSFPAISYKTEQKIMVVMKGLTCSVASFWQPCECSVTDGHVCGTDRNVTVINTCVSCLSLGTPLWGYTPPRAALYQEDRHSQNDISVDRARLVRHRYQSREHTHLC